jgi:hypothetical protein
LLNSFEFFSDRDLVDVLAQDVELLQVFVRLDPLIVEEEVTEFLAIAVLKDCSRKFFFTFNIKDGRTEFPLAFLLCWPDTSN